MKHIAELFLGKPLFSLQLKCRFKALAGLQKGMKNKSHKNREYHNSNEQSGVKCFDFSNISLMRAHSEQIVFIQKEALLHGA